MRNNDAETTLVSAWINNRIRIILVAFITFVVVLMAYVSVAMASHVPIESATDGSAYDQVEMTRDLEWSIATPRDRAMPVLIASSSDDLFDGFLRGFGIAGGSAAVSAVLAWLWYWGGAEALCLSGLFPPACVCVGPQC